MTATDPTSERDPIRITVSLDVTDVVAALERMATRLFTTRNTPPTERSTP